MRLILRIPEAWREVALALLMTAAALAELAGHDLLTSVGVGVAAACMTLPLALRFRFPLTVLCVVTGAWIVETSLGMKSGTPIVPPLAMLLALYAVGSRSRGVAFWAGGAIAAIGLAAQVLIREGVNFDLVTAVVGPAVVLLVGRALGVLTFETDVLEERAAAVERERDQRIEEAIGDERARIARELHDVIGHSISVMGVQAGAVRRRLTDQQDLERDALLSIEETGRQAVGEMRRLIGLLRTDLNGFEGPSPSLRQLERLASEMRDTGLRVRLDTRGPLDDLAAGVDLAAYRIVQEALTNVLKHAPGATVDVAVERDQRALAIDISDDGAGAVVHVNGHVGHGLVGMRERTALYGGTFHAGPRPGGGFAVSARIPLEAT